MLQIRCVPRKKKKKERKKKSQTSSQTGRQDWLNWSISTGCVGSKSLLCVALSVPLPVGGTWTQVLSQTWQMASPDRSRAVPVSPMAVVIQRVLPWVTGCFVL